MKLTFLKINDVYGFDKLEVIQNYGVAAGITDLAIIQGALLGNSGRTSDNLISCTYWLQDHSTTVYFDKYVQTIWTFGDINSDKTTSTRVSSRPIIPSEETQNITPKNIKIIHSSDNKTYKICEFGEYPQTVVTQDIHSQLETLYQQKNLKKTCKTYTFSQSEIIDTTTPYSLSQYQEYTLNNKKYIRIKAKIYDKDSIFNNGQKIKEHEIYWFEVQPIEWLIDKTGVWISKKCLFSGIPFDEKTTYYGNFENTQIHKYLLNHFSNEMQCKQEIKETMSRIAIHSKYFSNYITGTGKYKTFIPQGKNNIPFSPQLANEVISITNAQPIIRDLLMLIYSHPQNEQQQFKKTVLSIFDKNRDWRKQSNENIILGKKLAHIGKYEQELNVIINNIPEAPLTTQTSPKTASKNIKIPNDTAQHKSLIQNIKKLLKNRD